MVRGLRDFGIVRLRDFGLRNLWDFRIEDYGILIFQDCGIYNNHYEKICCGNFSMYPGLTYLQ